MSVGLGIMLTVLSGLCWGGLDALRKQLAGHLDALPLTIWLIVGQWPLFMLWVVMSGETQISIEWLAPGISVSAFAVLAAIAFIKAVQLSPLSLVIPMLSLTPVFAVCTSASLLGERPDQSQLIGIMLVVSGAFTLGREGRPAGGRAWREPGIWIMIGVALCWACTLTLDKLALKYADVPAHALAQSVVMGVSLLIILAARRQLHLLGSIRSHRRIYIFAVLLGSLATALQLIAVRVVLVGVVEGVKRSIGLAMAVLNGWIFFDEPPSPLKIAAIVWMGAGVMLLVI